MLKNTVVASCILPVLWTLVMAEHWFSMNPTALVILYQEEEAPGHRGMEGRPWDSRLQAERRGLRRNQTWQDLDLDFQPSDCEKTHFCQFSHLDCGFCHGCPGRLLSVGSETGTSTLHTSTDFSGSSSWRQSGSPPSLTPGGQICFILQLFTKGRALTKVKCSSNEGNSYLRASPLGSWLRWLIGHRPMIPPATKTQVPRRTNSPGQQQCRRQIATLMVSSVFSFGYLDFP